MIWLNSSMDVIVYLGLMSGPCRLLITAAMTMIWSKIFLKGASITLLNILNVFIRLIALSTWIRNVAISLVLRISWELSLRPLALWLFGDKPGWRVGYSVSHFAPEEGLWWWTLCQPWLRLPLQYSPRTPSQLLSGDQKCYQTKLQRRTKKHHLELFQPTPCTCSCLCIGNMSVPGSGCLEVVESQIPYNQ